MQPSLPHRTPFLLLDAVVEVVPGERAVAERLVTSADPLLRDGGELNEVLLVEVMAQCAGVAAASDGHGMTGALVAIDRFQVHRTVAVGDRITAAARVVKRMGEMVRADVTAHVDGTLCAEAQLTLKLTQ